MSDSKHALDAWKRADAEARAAESRLLAAWELYEKHLVAAPGPELLKQVAFLRSQANEKLMFAMLALAPAHERQSRSDREDSAAF